MMVPFRRCLPHSISPLEEAVSSEPDSLQTLGLSELLARARELGATILRDGKSLIKPAIKTSCLEKQNDRHEARGKHAEEAAGIKATSKGPALRTPLSAPSNIQAMTTIISHRSRME